MSLAQRLQEQSLYYTPQYREWLREHSRDHAAMAEFFQYLAGKEERNRVGTFSASGAGKCLRKRYEQFLSPERPADRQRLLPVFVNGDFVHYKHQLAALRMGLVDSYGDLEVSKTVGLLGGTADALTVDDGILEVKSMNSHLFKGLAKFGPSREHMEQMHSYMKLFDRGHVHYVVECKDTQNLFERKVRLDDVVMRRVERELKELSYHVQDKTVPPCTGKGKCCDV